MSIRRNRLLILTTGLALVLLLVPAGASANGVWSIDTPNSVTVLTEDYEGPIRILGEGATLDCNGHAVIGDNSTHGISVATNDVTIKDCVVSGFLTGIGMFGYMEGGVWYGFDGLHAIGNTAFGNSANGFAFLFATDVTAEGNKAYRNAESGFKVRSTDDSVLEYNRAWENGDFGIYLAGDSSMNRIERNTFSANRTGIATDVAAAANVIEDNKTRHNTDFGIAEDIDDDVNPPVVNNSYESNKCNANGLDASDPIGLCDK